MKLIKTWRWFGEDDPVKLEWLRELEIEEVVTALHHIPNGEIWPVEEIRKIKAKIENAGLRWTVVESLPVTEEIKTGSGLRAKHIQNYKTSLRNLSQCGIKTVTYNFMPVLDWVRTDLSYQLKTGGESMRFDYPTFAAFDIFILKRRGAEKDYSAEMYNKAEKIFESMSEEQADTLAQNIIVETQAFVDGVVDSSDSGSKGKFLEYLERYAKIGREELRTNLSWFLNQVIPVAEEVGIDMAIHPDDPPFPVLGLPRIFSTLEDIEWLAKTTPSPRNGIAFCSGSFSSRQDNDISEMARRFAHRIRFAHLRNTNVLEDGSFYETGHIHGRVNMPELVEILLEEMQKRKKTGKENYRIPMRSDHGINILNDFNLEGNPGYPLLGRLKGLAEISGMEEAILTNLKPK